MAIKILNDLLPIAEQTEVGVVKPDNVSITITETGELQSSVVDLPEDVVTAENYDNPKLWKGTLEEYNAIETKDPLVTYIITDDNVETLKTTDYNALSNKPSINDVTLEGNKTLEELNIQPADTSLTTSQITNCITKIPQDIELELVDGTLTLKAGSKVYVPNGPGIFDERIISSDVFMSNFGSASTDVMIFHLGSTNALSAVSSNVFSGSTAPTITAGTNAIWYDTANNKMMYTSNSGSTWSQSTHAFPLGIVTRSSGSATEIKQIFNGFGYIGSTLFALPGIEGLMPNGRNTDGSLKNIKYTINNTLTVQAGTTSNGYFGVVNGSFMRRYPANSVYDEDKNIWYNPETGNRFQFLYCGNFSEVSSRITLLNPKTTFNAIDRNDTEWASTQSKPSSRYIDLTLGASGSTYSAPANGWLSLWQKDGTTSVGKITMRNIKTRFGVGTENSTPGFTNLNLPVHKKEQINIYYSNITATDFQFRFYYDEGVK